MNLSIMQYGLLNALPQNNCLRCNSLIDLIYILAVRIAPKFTSKAVKRSITRERLVIKTLHYLNIILKQIILF